MFFYRCFHLFYRTPLGDCFCNENKWNSFKFWKWTQLSFCWSFRLLKLFLDAVARRCSVNKVFLEILQNSLENTCTRVSFLIKLQASGTREQETLAQEFFCQFCENSKNAFSYRTPAVAASECTLTNWNIWPWIHASLLHYIRIIFWLYVTN